MIFNGLFRMHNRLTSTLLQCQQIMEPSNSLYPGIYLSIGGWHASTENTDKVECYNPKTNQWTMCAPMKERRYRPGVAVVDGKIYVLGGEEGWDR